jgi:hypothetical protein
MGDTPCGLRFCQKDFEVGPSYTPCGLRFCQKDFEVGPSYTPCGLRFCQKDFEVGPSYCELTHKSPICCHIYKKQLSGKEFDLSA